MIPYNLYQNKNQNMPNAFEKWYARPVVTENVDLDYIAERIQRNSTAKKSDAKAVLTEMVEVITDCIQNGQRVCIDGFGAFKVGISSTGADSPEKFSVTENIRNMRVIFQPEVITDTATRKRTKKLLQGARLSRYSNKASAEEMNATASASGTGGASGTGDASGTGGEG